MWMTVFVSESVLTVILRELLQSEHQGKMCPNCGTELEDPDKMSIFDFLQILGILSIHSVTIQRNRIQLLLSRVLQYLQ